MKGRLVELKKDRIGIDFLRDFGTVLKQWGDEFFEIEGLHETENRIIEQLAAKDSFVRITKSNKKRRLELFRKWFDESSYRFISSDNCLIGQMYQFARLAQGKSPHFENESKTTKVVSSFYGLELRQVKNYFRGSWGEISFSEPKTLLDRIIRNKS